MARSDRARRVRAAAAQLSATYGMSFNATHDRGARWDLQWCDGPTRCSVASDLAAVDLAGAIVSTHRNYSTRAITLTVIREATRGTVPMTSRPSTSYLAELEWELEDIEHPQRASDDREELMIGRLLSEATPPGHRWAEPDTIVKLVAERGLAWLLHQEPNPATDPPLGPRHTAAGTPVEVLTERYAQGEANWLWQRRLRPMPAHAAMEAALFDPDIDLASSLALLQLLAQLRRQCAQAESMAVTAARAKGATWTVIASAMSHSPHEQPTHQS